LFVGKEVEMKLSKTQIKKILENWNVGEVVSFKKAFKGVVNHNWIVNTTKGKYVLRGVAFFKKLSELNFELRCLNYLKKRKFRYKIPVPLLTKDRMFLSKFQKNYFWVYEFIEGRDIKRFNRNELREVAKMMALYHDLIEKSKLDNGRGQGNVFCKNTVLGELNKFKSGILKKGKKDKKDRVFLNELLVLVPLLKSLNVGAYGKLRRYPLHRDINPENTLWKDGVLVGLIDFETVSEINEPFVKDIVVMLQYSCRDRKVPYKFDFGLFRYFLREYKRYRSLTSKEIEFIPDILIAGAIEDFSYQYWMFLNDPARAKLHRLKLYSKVAQWTNKNKKRIINELILNKQRGLFRTKIKILKLSGE